MQVDVYTEPEPLSKDVQLRIFSNPICPYVQRVRLLAAFKGIKTEEINIHLKVKPDWYLERVNPVGQVPTIEHNGHYIPDSPIAFAYIDEVFGEESAWPTDPYLRAKARLFVNDFDKKFTPNFYKHYRTDSVTEKDSDELVKFVANMEEILGTQKYFWGQGKPGAADFLVWPWIERLEAVQTFNAGLGEKITASKFPQFFDYISRMLQNDIVKETALSTDMHLKFLKDALSTGKHDYSLVDKTGKGVVIYTKK